MRIGLRGALRRAAYHLKMKTPPAPEGTDGVFHAFTSGKVAALD